MISEISGDCLVEVSGEGCAACLAVLPNCAAVAKKFGLKLVKISVEEEPQAIEKFSLSRIPSIIVVKGGEVVAACSGYQPPEIMELWVQAKLGL